MKRLNYYSKLLLYNVSFRTHLTTIVTDPQVAFAKPTMHHSHCLYQFFFSNSIYSWLAKDIISPLFIVECYYNYVELSMYIFHLSESETDRYVCIGVEYIEKIGFNIISITTCLVILRIKTWKLFELLMFKQEEGKIQVSVENISEHFILFS